MVRKNALIELALCELQDTLSAVREAQEKDKDKLLELSCVAYTAQLLIMRKLGLINNMQYEALTFCIISPLLTVYDAFELNNVVIIGGADNE